MKVALASDEPYPVHQTVRAELEKLGHTVLPFGSVLTGKEAPWALVADEAAQAVQRGEAQAGILFCWSGTGICMAANKLSGIRAALCTDPGTARAAREWNHANVLCLSNRTLSDDMAKEILEAWFTTEPARKGASGVALLNAIDERCRSEQSPFI